MSRTFGYVAAIFFLMLGALASSARADWPARLFVPGVYVTRAGTQLTDCYKATGQKYFLLNFVTTNRTTGDVLFGGQPPSTHFFADQIAAIRALGGDVVMSSGGAGSREVAMTETDAAKIQAKYQAIVSEYKLTWMDFDIEGAALADPVVNQRRNAALAGLQKANPGFTVVYTLPANPNTDSSDLTTEGINTDALAVLRDAKQKGLKVTAANIMCMDYGAAYTKGKRMSDVVINTITIAHQEVQAIDPDMKVGITPMLGVNDEKSEIFTPDDARRVMDWVQDKPWVRMITFWVLSRDNGSGAPRAAATRAATRGRRGDGGGGGDRSSGIAQKDFEFTNTFKTFTTGFTPAPQS